MQNEDKRNYKYVFVCGLHRSGTSLIGRNIARLEGCSGFKNTGRLMDEGQLLQNVYPPAREFGGAGRFGFDPRTHRTETSSLLTPANVARLHASWHRYWDSSKSIFVEKTPGNLLMTRFLQAAFPTSYFVVIRRHPVPVSLATQQWRLNLSSIHKLFDHWLHCHEVFEQDKQYLKNVYELRYEDYVQNSAKHHEAIAAFIGTRTPEPPQEDRFRSVTDWRSATGFLVPEKGMEKTSGDFNLKYFNRWSFLLQKSTFRNYYRIIALKYEHEFIKYGYSLTEGYGTDIALLGSRRKTSAIFAACYCAAADINAFCRRSVSWSRWCLRERIKERLPEAVLERLRRARESIRRPMAVMKL
jgi:hypothetical protein